MRFYDIWSANEVIATVSDKPVSREELYKDDDETTAAA